MGYSVQSFQQSGTWIPVYTGYASDPTTTVARYYLVGKLCTVHLIQANQTSNATTLTVTLPFAAANTAVQSFTTGVCVDNGANVANAPLFRTTVNSNILNCYKTSALGAWTASGNKSIAFVFTYEIA